MKVKAADALLFHPLTQTHTHSVQSVGFRYWFPASAQIFWPKEKGGDLSQDASDRIGGHIMVHSPSLKQIVESLRSYFFCLCNTKAAAR